MSNTPGASPGVAPGAAPPARPQAPEPSPQAAGAAREARPAGQPLPLTRSRTSPLHAALDYCARELLTELQPPQAQGRPRLRPHLSATSTALLHWWFSDGIRATRVDNFHTGQREAILHTVLAHEILQSDDPVLLQRLACHADRIAEQAHPQSPAVPRCAAYTLQMAPGSGLAWTAQALLLWQWANHAAARAADRDDPRFSDRLLLIAATPAIRESLNDALFGAADAGGRRDPAHGTMMRHARVFLPPSLRAPFYGWLLSRLRHADRAPLVVAAPDSATAPPVAMTLVAGTGADIIAGRSTAASMPSQATASLLWIDLEHVLARPSPQAAHRTAALAVFDPPRAILHGATKLPMLEPVAHLRLPPLHPLPPRARPQHSGLRPRLRHDHRQLLQQGLDALARRDHAFASLDAGRRPRMLVLCDLPQTLRAARAFLKAQGIAAEEIATAPAHAQATARIAIDHLPARHTAADARICVIVALRTCAGRAAHAGLELLHAGLRPLWPEPDYAAVRVVNRERTMSGRPPDNLLDVLSVIDHPHCHESLRAACAGMIAHASSSEVSSATGGIIATGLRGDADRFDLLLPPLCADLDALEEPERLSSVPVRHLHARQTMAVRKSIHPLAGWSAQDNGLRRAFLEAAELDDAIESHCLLDPRRHACRSRDTLLTLGFDGRGLVDGVVRTATHVFLVELLPFGPAQPTPTDMAEMAIRRWCRRTNALPPAQRSGRLWRRVRLQAPLFWTCKRSGVPLSTLLAALADTRVLAPRIRPVRPALATE